MLFVHFVFSKSRFQGPANHCDKIVVTVTLLEVIDRLDFRRSLVSGQFGEERGLLSRTAAGNRAQVIEGIPDKDCNFWGNENFHNLYDRLLYERKLKNGYLERHI